MLGTYITFSELLILIPLLAGIICFAWGKKRIARDIALLASIAVFIVSVCSMVDTDPTHSNVAYLWLTGIGSSYSVGLDGTGRILTLLTAISYPLIFVATYYTKYKKSHAFYGLMLLSQAGIMGVFVAMDALVFYFFWELALIPVYFLCSRWGGPKRIQTTFKFFVYTFAGSLLMLIGIIYVYLHTAPKMIDGVMVAHSFSLQHFQNALLTSGEQNGLFWLFFVAFAIKMPIFPFHTWQPDTYEQSPPAVTMVLSAVMVKMGLLGVVRWLIPVFPQATERFADIVMILSIVGILYASCIAIVQDNLKKLLAYSSIAHIGLICAAFMSLESIGVQGAMLQMFSHGINILGLWIVMDRIEQKTGTLSISELSGVAKKAPMLTIFLVIISFANIALPLTNAFIGEFMMFSGIWSYNNLFAAFAAISIILAAVYSLRMVRNVFYGEANARTEHLTDIRPSQIAVFTAIVAAIFMIGVYPEPMIHLTEQAVAELIALAQ